AFRWFADVAVDAAVVEVGLGGRWDTTNVADAAVAVVTNVALDHAETIGPRLIDIATEKAGIVKPDSFLVLGETDENLASVFRERPSAGVWQRGPDFGVAANRQAVGGRSVDLYSAEGATYEDVFLPLHGAFQGDNAATAGAATQAFFGHPLDDTLVRAALSTVEVPGRMEVVGREPLVVVDGAHNPAGAEAAIAALSEAFGDGPRILVVGMLRDRDPVEMLTALRAADARLVIAVTASSPRALPAEDIVAAAGRAGITARAAASVAEGVAWALDAAGPTETVFVAGSLYVAGPARTALVRGGTTARSARPASPGPRPRS
ncbi:MAG: glutamate ligase domain-containing protein, partial [Acidimicrobiales bacterium]